ncbi:hypothetical protein B4133_0819 [Bacillus altitudinis]|nr:hypothetical protein B4133_0819 [Bacillus altitudinis]
MSYGELPLSHIMLDHIYSLFRPARIYSSLFSYSMTRNPY